MKRRSSDEHLEQLLTRSLGGAAASAGVCPDGDILAAFLDGGLDRPERVRVTQHAASCARCAQILAVAAEPQAPEAVARPAAVRSWRARWRWLIPVATAATVAGVWVATRDVVAPVSLPTPSSRSDTASREAAGESARPPAARAPAVVPDQPAPDVQETLMRAKPSSQAEQRRESAAAAGPARDEQVARESAAANPDPPPAASPPALVIPAFPRAVPPPAAAPEQSGGGVRAGDIGGGLAETISVPGDRPTADLQGVARQVMFVPLWQLSGTLIQRSVDGGRTWRTEFEAPRVTLGGSTPTDDVGWFVGVRGLVIRRVGSNWSLVTAPADIDVVSVRATDDRNASVTLSDGRVFATTDGGATWAPR